ncbi:uncharacterized protein MYCFIDRAFT_211101 [Pseudocercospora fijiensis CIRAD86]|uniref:Interferon-related developmental regulator N-terminal domain-containing protein n=1 Tax=Pseudocercospora fijiensis (strain CIRAD86) TaxID=383855 RepID=M2ZUC3_PSEFD|nr:uncharacterized protein MYCFIDRAFT_211101 [Pseudocercospora fijiensis CIRAD86]EME82604.1 hypothetical protein MYCFIDRAFT_211101 [Pseudocercospora fijiensis CIRAD86]
MREKDLRKIALESGKTVSRKARSKESTPPISRGSSAQPSPRGSRIASRQGSDDESELSDTTEWSTNSIDALVAPSELDDGPGDAWAAELEDCINTLIDRKRTSTEGREQYLSRFNLILTRHYAQEELKSKIDDIVPILLKSVKSGQSEREVILALKGLALIIITEPSETVYDTVQGIFKSTINDSQHGPAKVAAIHALSIATFYGGATVEETEEVMQFFLEIASSDGAVVEAEDDAEVVVASLGEWGLLATQLDDMEDATEEAMDTFVDQLESSDVGVQIAAGDNIALLYEKSFTEAESDDEPADSDDEDRARGPRMIKRYTVYRQEHLLQQRLEKLAKGHSKRVSKQDRKNLHIEFKDILNTVEKPTRGPRYSTALDEEGREYGSRMKVTIHGGGKMSIDKWWKLHRLSALKRLLQSGFMVHYEHNQVVFDSLPVIVEDN